MSVSAGLSEPPVQKEPVYIIALWFIGGALTFWSFGYTLMRGSDLWWHIAGGQYIIEHFGLPATDPWSFTAATSRWVVDAWGTEVLLALWSRLFGMASLVWWKWLVVTGTFLALMRLLWRLTGNLPAAYLSAFLAVAVAAPFMDMRPQLFSLLGFVILLDMTLKREKLSWWLVALYWVWANLHAGFTLGLLMMPILLFPFVANPVTRKRTLLIAAASWLVCLINPNGIHSFTQPIIYALDTDSPFKSLGEWHPPFTPGGIQSPPYPYAIGVFGVSVIAVVALHFKKRVRVDWRIVLVGLLTLAMSLKSRRFISSFAIGQSLVVAAALGTGLKRIPWRWPRFAFPVTATLTGALLLFPYPQRAYAFQYLTADYTFPIATVDMMNANNLSGDIFAYYNWGGYLHLKTQGRLKVYIDGRASAVFDAKTYLDYVKVLGMQNGWMDIIEQTDAKYFLWPHNKPRQLQYLKKTGRWKSIYADGVSELLARETVPLPKELKAPPSSTYRKLGECRKKLMSRWFASAEACCTVALEKDPHNFLAMDFKVRAQIAQGAFDDARETARLLQKEFPHEQHQESIAKLISSRESRSR